jgi:hypothetical protein
MRRLIMAERTGEKTGWIGGWLGGFIWVAVLSGVFFYQGKSLEGGIGLSVVVLAIFSILYFAPWRHAETHYWKLMLAPYFVFFLSVLWGIWAYGGVKNLGLSWWNLFSILPLLIPFGSGGFRKWTDGGGR